jgi:hypothetical protein
MGGKRNKKNHPEKHAKTKQQIEPRKKYQNATTLAPGVTPQTFQRSPGGDATEALANSHDLPAGPSV